MTLFNYKLKNLKDISFWHDKDKKYIHWYGLTDGEFYMNVNNEKLFQYSDNIVKLWKKDIPEYNSETNFVEYQIARPFEDLCEIMSDILNPIPNNIFEFISSKEKQFNLQTDIQNLYDSLQDDDDLLDTISTATDWIDLRRFPTSHLKYGPKVWFLLCEDKVYIRWNNENAVESGVPVWSSIFGEVIFTKEEFIEEIRLFHSRLMSDMENRIQNIVINNPIPEVFVDIDTLKVEHDKKKNSLRNALESKTSKIEWSLVKNAIDKVI